MTNATRNIIKWNIETDMAGRGLDIRMKGVFA
jgi:hypothetical protein